MFDPFWKMFGPFWGGVIVMMASIGLFIIIISFFIKKHIRDKCKQLSCLAEIKGYSFNYLDKGQLAAKYNDYKVSDKKGRRGIPQNIIKAKVSDINITLFECFYTLPAENGAVGYIDNVVMFSVIDTPSFILRPRELSDRVCIKSDRYFKSHLNFSSKYVLSGENKSQVKSFFREAALTYFSTSPDHKVEVRNSYIAIVWSGLREPEQYFSLIDESLSLWKLIKPSV